MRGQLADLEEHVDFILPSHNEPLLESAYLTRLRDAFQAMKEETMRFALTDGNREYAFDGFSIIVSDPPPWDQ